MNKEELAKLGREAAKAYLTQKTPMRETLVKMAKAHALTDHQVERVCHFANHAANHELMKKEGYTEFEIVRPSDVIDHAKLAHTFYFSSEIEETASEIEKMAGETPDDIPLDVSSFNKLASYYGQMFTTTGDTDEDLRRLTIVLDKIANSALESLAISKFALDSSEEAIYEDMRQALLSGVPLEDVLRGVGERAQDIEPILDRLEANGLVPQSSYQDAGPSSMERMHKRAIAFDIVPDAPILKKISALIDARDEMELAVKTAEICYGSLSRIEKIAKSGEAPSYLAKTAASSKLDIVKRIASGAGKPVSAYGRWINRGKGWGKAGRLFMSTAGLGAVGEGYGAAKEKLNTPRMRVM